PPDSARADYNTLQEAVSALGAGISDSVIFNVLPGNYDVYITIGNINGAGPDKQVVFQSSTGDPADVFLNYFYTYVCCGVDNFWVISLTNASYLTFKNMSFNAAVGNPNYGRIIRIEGHAHHINFIGNVFYGKAGTMDVGLGTLIWGPNYRNEHFVIEHNEFHNGEDAINLTGVSANDLSAGNIIRHNKFYNQNARSIFLVDQDAPIISDNYFENYRSEKVSIQMYYCDNATRITNNIIEMNYPNLAIYLYNCDGLANMEGMIANNFIEGIGAGPTNTARGIHLYACTNLKIYHNSIAIHHDTKETSACFYQYSGANLDVRNNIFYNTSGGYAAYFPHTGSIINTNNNDYYTNGNYIVRWGSSNLKDLAALQTVRSPFDDASVSVNPAFYSFNPIDLHTTSFFLKNAGVDLSMDVPEDIDGESRSATPCIGADEYTTVTGAPLSGTITIGSDQEFKTISSVVDSMNLYGISGPLTINIKDNGSPYEEQVTIGQITGADTSNRITFQPDPGNTGDVVIQYGAQTSWDPWIIRFNRASYISLKNLTLSSHSSTYPGVIFFEGNSNHDSILNCTISSIENTPGTNSIWGSDVGVNDLAIIGNTITNAGTGISFTGINNPDSYSKNMVISNNIFSSHNNACIYLERFDAPVVTDNYINSDNLASDFYGIDIRTCPKGVTVTGNTVICNNAGWGISLDNCVKSFGDESLVANNIVDVRGGTDTATCIQTINSAYVNVYFNTVRIGAINTEVNSNAYVNTNGSNINVRNNIFCNFGLGRAYYNEQIDAIDISNNNALFTAGLYIARWDTNDMSTLEELKTASGMDDLSKVANPAFESADDLHANSFYLDGTGASIAGITLDKDGVTRSDPPDIGAYEYSSTLSPMSGTYTIFGDTPDFGSIKQATDSLQLLGISGPVTLNIRDNGSPHEEQIHLGEVQGTDASNRITFQSDPGNTVDVVFQYSGQTSEYPWIIRFNRASYISLKNLTLSSHNSTWPGVIFFEGNSNHDSILNCTINSTGNATGSNAIWGSDEGLSDISIIGNTITDAETGISFSGINNPDKYPKNMVISNNIFNGQNNGSIYLERCEAPVVNDNLINSDNSTSDFYGIDLRTCPKGITLTGNTVILNNAAKGISLDNCVRAFGNESLVANNIVDVRGGTDTATCIQTINSDYVNVYFNTIRIGSFNTEVNSNAYLNTNGSNINVRNNIFCNFGMGRAFYNEQTDAIDISNNNALFTAGLYVARWDTNEIATLEEWKTTTGLDDLSLVANPAFESADDLHVNSYYIDGAGAAIAGITLDKDGVTREAPPDIGAYEISSPLAPMAGTYTIYGDSPDFAGIKQALDTLQHRGVSGPVDLVIRSGEYEEYVGEVRKITGASAKNDIVIRSESGNPEDVTIFSAQEADLIGFRSVDHVTIKDLTIFANGSSAGRPLGFLGTCKNIRVVNNRLVSANSMWPTLSFGYCITDSVLIKDNYISSVTRGISFYSNQNRSATNTAITGNYITGASDLGIVLANHTAPKLVGNHITSRIYLGGCHGDLVVSGNRINFLHPEDYESGIYLGTCYANEIFNGLVSNNMIHVGGTALYTRGIHISSSEYINLYHNSVHMSNTGTCIVEAKWQETESKGINIVNNVLSGSGGGGAIGIGEPTSIQTSDFNSFYSKVGSMLGSWGGTQCTDLAAFQAASGTDVNSIEVDPLFYSDADLYSKQPAFNQKATPLPEVPYDIDSTLRDALNPDLGAAEFSCVTPTFNIYFAPACLGDSTIIFDSSMNIAAGSIRGWDFNGDLVPDIYSENDFDTITWLFEGAGDDSVSYIVEQVAGCRDQITIDVPYALQPDLDITTKGAYCDATDGWASVSVTNLPGPFQYFWSDGQTLKTATDLALGTYTVAVIDETGCTTTEDVEIGEAIQVTVTQIRPSICGMPNGSAVVSARGGFAPYSFVWSNGETADTNDILSPGPHYVNVIDSKGCYALGSISLEGDGGPQVNLVDATINDCYADKSGSIDIFITGGVAPYSYQWSNGSTTQDINNLAAGIYHVTVEDRDGCQGAGSFQILQPSQITISPVVSASSCEGTDGSAIAVVSGGTKPYTYNWSSGGNYQIEKGLEAGVYSVTVTDGKGCQMVEPVIVNNTNAPVVSITDVQGVGCSVTDNGSISILASPPDTNYIYSWSNGDTTTTITDLTAGSYEVTVTDELGCKGVNQAVVRQEPPEVNPICLVTVDTASGKNMIVWEKLVTEDVSHYNVYRESSVKSDYQLIASVPITEESLYIDSVADPTIRSWRYRLSVVDSCGNESELSEAHKTMHLTMNVGLDNTVNLIWDHYEGFDIGTYEVYRYDANDGWKNLDNMTSTNTSYSDNNPPVEDLTYYIEVDKPGVCTTSDKKASSLNSSRSNRKTKLKSYLNQPPTDITLDMNIIDENEAVGTLIGRFITTDIDGDTHDYSLIAGFGSDDNNSFSISGDSLLSAEVFDYETKSTYSILVSTTDTGSLSFEKQFTILINDVVEVGLSQISGQKIMIYPNPFNTSTTIRFPGSSGESYRMFLTDLSGKVCRIVDDITTSEYVLKKEDLKEGLYFIELRGPKIYRGKIVIE
ncbi:NosD domain-containing protein, partial [Bacteroidota bacterium]